MAAHNELGKKGELIAAAYLIRKGYTIHEVNWCYNKAEVDIIAEDGRFIVFVEVKTRSSTSFGQPEEFVSTQKQRHLQRAAEGYLFKTGYKGEVRFDIVSVLFNDTGAYEIYHIEDAFWG